MRLKVRLNLSRALICVALVFFGAVMLAFPDRYFPRCFEGICLWAECVLPSLFPFAVITLLLSALGAVNAAAKPFKRVCRKLNLPEATPPLFVLSLCAGYPAGSRILYEYREAGALCEVDCKRLAPLISACGPTLAIGTVGAKAFGGGGVKLFLSCLASVVVTSLIYCLITKNKTPALKRVAPQSKNNESLKACFTGAVNASLTAGAFIAFFYTLAGAAADFKLLYPAELILSKPFGKGCASALCTGLIEATSGCFALAGCGGFFALPLAAFLITFGGLSIILQQTCYLTFCGVSFKRFFVIKLLQGVVSFCILCIVQLF